jgi:hypothetical protein
MLPKERPKTDRSRALEEMLEQASQSDIAATALKAYESWAELERAMRPFNYFGTYAIASSTNTSEDPAE